MKKGENRKKIVRTEGRSYDELVTKGRERKETIINVKGYETG